MNLLHHGLETMRPVIQLKSVFLTLFSSLSCALESFGSTSSTEPWALSSCWLSRVSISPSESSSSFSLSISCSEDSISSLWSCQQNQNIKWMCFQYRSSQKKKEKGNWEDRVMFTVVNFQRKQIIIIINCACKEKPEGVLPDSGVGDQEGIDKHWAQDWSSR